jgi:hypothetical protein
VLSLQEDDSFLRIRYTLSNLARHPIDFLWNIHPALAISEHTRLAVPAERGITDPWRETQFQGNTAFTWPNAVDRDGRKVDLRRVNPPGAAVADMHYLVDVRDGWYAATDQAAGVGFALAFPRAIFPHVWLFRALGGWRGLYTLILEASTGYPYDLDVARQRGTCGHLEPGASIEAEVLAIAYSGVSDVADVRPTEKILPSFARGQRISKWSWWPNRLQLTTALRRDSVEISGSGSPRLPPRLGRPPQEKSVSETDTIQSISLPRHQLATPALRRMPARRFRPFLAEFDGLVCGGPVAVIQALQDALALTARWSCRRTGDWSDPGWLGAPPVPQDWWPVIRKRCRPTTQHRTRHDASPNRSGTRPDVLRSGHPVDPSPPTGSTLQPSLPLTR